MKLEWACIIRAPSEGDQRCSVSDFVLTLEFKDEGWFAATAGSQWPPSR